MVIILIVVIIALTFLYYKIHLGNINKIRDNLITNNETTDNLDILSYKDYKELFETMVKTFNIEGFKVKASTIDGNVTAIEKELSFGKREFLTLNGDFNSPNTDEQFTIENEKQNIQITVGIYYTKNYIGNDFVGWIYNKGFAHLNKNLAEKNSTAVLTYKNLIVLVQYSSTSEVDISLMNNVMKALIEILKNFDKTKND
ncbi:hypothetical protein TheetDRAFT_2539 [Thermoanaerobacter ethanolicus JW 200]|nr:hypothetical protein TheetDRAFT_2539 [Thermoanaerobacter ethanolicus JW 200]